MMKLPSVVLVIALLCSCKEKTEQARPAIEKITESVYASGIVKSRNQYQVFSTVTGRIREIMVREGDIVRKGDPIMRLSSVAARLNTENAEIAVRYASLPANADKLNELKQNIEIAKAKKEYDALILSRQRILWAQGIGTRNNLDGAELAYQTSNSSYEAARLRYKDMERQLAFQASQAEKNLQISETIAGDYVITSDVNGKVYSLLKKPGELVNVQAPVALIGDASGFMLELQVDEYDIAKIKPGQKVLLVMDSYRGQVFEAAIEMINPAMNPLSRSFTVDAAFTVAPSVLYPNLTTEANIIIQVKEKALTIPRSFLVNDSFVILASKARRRVITGLKDYQKAEILSGLSADDIILKPAP